MTRSMFTLTAGRTGTAWLADFLGENLGVHAIHEPLGIHDFGEVMPNIRTMRCFNTFGNDAFVQAFWARKLGAITGDWHVETNHTLGKCGLIENLSASPLAHGATVIVLRRDMVKQCVSYLARGDFNNITVPWQWYLVPGYSRKIVTFGPFERMGLIGHALWYCYEMAARQAYYVQLFGNRLAFVEADLEEITTPEGAQDFWQRIGGEGECVLPPPRNASAAAPPQDLLEQVSQVTSRIAFDPGEVARTAIAQGFRFDPKSEPARRIA